MHVLLGLLIVFMAVPTWAQTMLNAQQVQRYYDNCKRNAAAEQKLTPETQDIFCQCTARMTQQNMSMDDIKATTGNDQNARNAINKLMISVYAPCMEFPVRDLIHTKCQADVAQTGICTCLSSNMAKYTQDQAVKLLSGILVKNPNVFDPMGAILESPEFQAEQKRITLQCLTGNLK